MAITASLQFIQLPLPLFSQIFEKGGGGVFEEQQDKQTDLNLRWVDIIVRHEIKDGGKYCHPRIQDGGHCCQPWNPR